jgi:hypothetical protein
MQSNSAKTACVAAIAICLFGFSAQAAEDGSHRLNGAWTGFLAGAEPVLTPQQAAKVNNLAYQAAVTRICDGFDIDEARFMTALEDATSKSGDKLSDDALVARHNFLLVDLGMRVGVFVAEGAANQSSFCSNAREIKAQSELPHVWE